MQGLNFIVLLAGGAVGVSPPICSDPMPPMPYGHNVWTAVPLCPYTPPPLLKTLLLYNMGDQSGLGCSRQKILQLENREKHMNNDIWKS